MLRVKIHKDRLQIPDWEALLQKQDRHSRIERTRFSITKAMHSEVTSIWRAIWHNCLFSTRLDECNRLVLFFDCIFSRCPWFLYRQHNKRCRGNYCFWTRNVTNSFRTQWNRFAVHLSVRLLPRATTFDEQMIDNKKPNQSELEVFN